MRLLAIVMITLLSYGAKAQEYKYHPIFIYNFSKYIEWPAPQVGSDFVICVIGDDEAYQQMMTLSQKKKTVNGQPLVVKKCNTLKEVNKSNIVFITKDAKVSSQEIKEKLGQSTTLFYYRTAGNGGARGAYQLYCDG